MASHMINKYNLEKDGLIILIYTIRKNTVKYTIGKSIISFL